VVVVIILASPVILLGVFGPTAWQIGIPSVSGMARVREAQVGQRYRYPVDSAITPLDAGVAFNTLISIGRPEQPPSGARPDQPPQAARRRPPQQPEVVSLVPRATGGFSDEETEYLERVATHPAFDEYRTVARAPAIDWLAATYDLPFPDTLTWLDVRIPRYGAVRRASYAHIAKAALELSQGRDREAEATLREVISFGLTLMEHDLTLIGDLFGSIVVGYGLDALEELYSATGRDTDARQLRTARDSVDRISSELEVVEVQASGSRATQYALDVRLGLVNIVQDTMALRGLRWDMLAQLMAAPCTNIRELIFGPDEGLQLLFDYAREDLVRMPSEEALFELLEESPQRMRYVIDDVEGGLSSRAFYGIGRVTGTMLGNDRIAGCAALLPRLVEFF
jgi:hypothetical protein